MYSTPRPTSKYSTLDLFLLYFLAIERDNGAHSIHQWYEKLATCYHTVVDQKVPSESTPSKLTSDEDMESVNSCVYLYISYFVGQPLHVTAN